MNRPAMTLATGASLVAVIAMIAPAQQSGPRRSLRTTAATAEDGSIVVFGTLEWLEVAQLSALQEGNVKWLEPQVGSRVVEGQEIGQLHDEIARLNAEKARLIAESTAGIAKAKAQFDQAAAKLARDLEINKRSPGAISREEIDKDTADVNYADALRQEAMEKRLVDAKEAELAEAILRQHTIVSPITGYVLDRMKNPGESVRANEPLLRIGKTDRFKFVGWVPLEVSQRIRVGDVVEFRPVEPDADLPIEKRVFDGKIMAVNREASTVGGSEVSVLAEINNPANEAQPELELIQGMRGELRILRPGSGVAGGNASATRPVDGSDLRSASAR
ncbi:MAG: hypothetical protein KatS3mg108_2995 [Isosphaeraceae bacterium]|jgi:multidrug efflux pump subunit AcrA (membrane-fusion protein)|nr:MAG: hypothetical protein KatS3mg108_2995 [Isosphaeraceae bacterium]